MHPREKAARQKGSEARAYRARLQGTCQPEGKGRRCGGFSRVGGIWIYRTYPHTHIQIYMDDQNMQ